MDREPPVDRIGAKAPPDSQKPNVDPGAGRADGAKASPSTAWLKPLDSYDRRERREFQVTRFG
jgi:hypothetical protein